jgi:hypothetical protein
VDAGAEALFLPDSEAPMGFRAVESNIRSLLHLTEDLRSALPLEKLLLWSESGKTSLSAWRRCLSDSVTEPRWSRSGCDQRPRAVAPNFRMAGTSQGRET